MTRTFEIVVNDPRQAYRTARRRIVVRLEIDDLAIADIYGIRAYHNRSRKSGIGRGLVTVMYLRDLGPIPES